jgi:hypothetical protein
MIKQLLFSTAFTLSFNVVLSQCTPDQSIANSNYSTSPPGYAMPLATPGQPYNATISIKTPLTATQADIPQIPFPGVTVNINWIKLTGIQNLPPGLNFQCDNANCQWAGNTLGCVLISGTPTLSGGATWQNFPLEIQLLGNGTLPPPFGTIEQAFTRNDYGIEVGTVNVEENSLIQSTNVYPNPANQMARLNFKSSQSGNGTIRIFDITGKTTTQINLPIFQGENNTNIDLTSYTSGVYFFIVEMQNSTQTGKIIVKKN